MAVFSEGGSGIGLVERYILR